MTKIRFLCMSIGGILLGVPTLVLVVRYGIPTYMDCWRADSFWTTIITSFVIGVLLLEYAIPSTPGYSRPVPRPANARPPAQGGIMEKKP